jgi:hypothetical protein
MTERSSVEDGVSRREFMVAAGTAAVLSGAFAASGTPASAAASANEICRMDAVTLAEKIRTKQLSPTEVTADDHSMYPQAIKFHWEKIL